jgi:isopenicillin N synthase-like dioxygenase
VTIPLIDVSPLATSMGSSEVGAQIDQACRGSGFFSIVGHGVPAELVERLTLTAREFFALTDDEKSDITMARGGRAWRGWFPVGGELTSGIPDMKEGLYFGQELPLDDPRVMAGTPLHGPNLFPVRPPELREVVLEYIDTLTDLGHRLLRGISLGLGLEGDWFDRHLTRDPLVLFRIFHYPPIAEQDEPRWSVGQHTDYGLITILGQDDSGGLEVEGPSGWIAVPPIPGAFVVNLGDMLERMTSGAYRSTPHRVRHTGDGGRLSFPLFIDPAWDAAVVPVPVAGTSPRLDAANRWDGRSVHEWSGTYGDYLWTKVGRVFPQLKNELF